MSAVTYQHFAGTAPESYERHFVPAIGAPLARELVDRAALRRGDRVLDVACGTGVVARMAAEEVGEGGSVTGVDLTPGMLGVARTVAPEAHGIEWVEANAEDLPLPAHSFDVVLCQMGLQFFGDRPAALGEMRRVLAPGGRVLLNVPGPTPPPFTAMAEALGEHIGAELAGFVHAVFSLHEPDVVRALLDSAGFRDVVVDKPVRTLRLPPPEAFLWQYVTATPMAAGVGQAGDDARTALRDEFVERCSPYVEDGALVVEVGIVTAIGRRP